MFLNSSSIMRARRLQEAFSRSILPFWNQENASSSQRLKTLAKVFLRLFIIACSWDLIIAGFMDKFLRFKTRKWKRQFVFFRRYHRWVSGATVVVMSEAVSINIIFAFSQRWSFHYFIWPTARVIVVCYTAVFSVVTQRSSPQRGGALRYDTENGCVAD